ncbi:MAG: hypothetical protein ACRDOK_01765 [Streptosporangiaceae bacterium]
MSIGVDDRWTQLRQRISSDLLGSAAKRIVLRWMDDLEKPARHPPLLHQRKMIMSTTEVRHSESWQLTIRPEENDADWPAEHKGRYTGRIRPDVIHVNFSRGQGSYTGSASGFKILKNGQPSERMRGTDQWWYSGPAPEWAKAIIETEIVGAGLITDLMDSNE